MVHAVECPLSSKTRDHPPPSTDRHVAHSIASNQALRGAQYRTKNRTNILINLNKTRLDNETENHVESMGASYFLDARIDLIQNQDTNI